MKQLSFAEERHYPDDDEGIPFSVTLIYGAQSLRMNAKVDPGAAVCLFTNEIGRDLGIPIEQGIPKRLGGLTGSLDAFGHEVTLQTGDIVFQSVVYFAKYPGLPRNLLGRAGWRRKLRLAVIDYDNLLSASMARELPCARPLIITDCARSAHFRAVFNCVYGSEVWGRLGTCPTPRCRTHWRKPYTELKTDLVFSSQPRQPRQLLNRSKLPWNSLHHEETKRTKRT